MVILHLIQKPQLRGAEIFASQLAQRQKEEGHKVVIVSVFKGEGDLDFDGEILCLNANQKSTLVDYRGWKVLKNIILKVQPDILQANAGDTLKYAVLSKVILGWKTPIIFRNASQVGRYLTSRRQKWFYNFIYKKIDAVASVSEASKKDLLRHFPYLKEKVKVIPIGIEREKNIPKHYFLPVGGKHIVHIGGFTFEKNHEELLKIFEMIQKEMVNVHLHLVGDGPLRNEIEQLVEKLNLKERVSFYGFVSNPLSYIKGADLLVLPSIIEGLPGVLLEALYCKTPVVAYDVGGIAEIITVDTGDLIPAGQTALFSKACIDILKKPTSTKVEKGYLNVVQNYLNVEIAKKFLTFYEGINLGKG